MTISNFSFAEPQLQRIIGNFIWFIKSKEPYICKYPKSLKYFLKSPTDGILSKEERPSNLRFGACLIIYDVKALKPTSGDLNS